MYVMAIMIAQVILYKMNVVVNVMIQITIQEHANMLS